MVPHDPAVGLDEALAFGQALLEQGVSVECSVVSRPGVDLALAEAAVVRGLGVAPAPFKVRPYYP